MRLCDNLTITNSTIAENASPGGAAGVYAFVSRMFAFDTLFDSNLVVAATPGGDHGIAILVQGDRLTGFRSGPSNFCRGEVWCGAATLEIRCGPLRIPTSAGCAFVCLKQSIALECCYACVSCMRLLLMTTSLPATVHRRCVFRGNRAMMTSAAGIYANNPVFASIADSVFESNTASGGGGGAIQFNGGYGALSVSGSLFKSNTADRCGALHFTSGGLLSLENNTFAENIALAGPGGAVCVERPAEAVAVCDRTGALAQLPGISGDVIPIVPAASGPPAALASLNCSWRIAAPWAARCRSEIVITHLTVAGRSTYFVGVEDGDTVRLPRISHLNAPIASIGHHRLPDPFGWLFAFLSAF